MSRPAGSRYLSTRVRICMWPSLKQIHIGRRYLSNATWLIRPHVSHACLAEVRNIITCCMIRHVWSWINHVLDKHCATDTAHGCAVRHASAAYANTAMRKALRRCTSLRLKCIYQDVYSIWLYGTSYVHLCILYYYMYIYIYIYICMYMCTQSVKIAYLFNLARILTNSQYSD